MIGNKASLPGNYSFEVSVALVYKQRSLISYYREYYITRDNESPGFFHVEVYFERLANRLTKNNSLHSG